MKLEVQGPSFEWALSNTVRGTMRVFLKESSKLISFRPPEPGSAPDEFITYSTVPHTNKELKIRSPDEFITYSTVPHTNKELKIR